MNGNNELLTISEHWKEWSDLRFIVLVLANRDLNQVTWEQRVLAGDPKFETPQHVPDFQFARYADLLGLTGIRIDDPDDVGPAWERALAADRPVVYEVLTDPEVPTLPPHITFKMAKNYMSTMFSDPNGPDMVRGTLKDAIQGVLPHKK